MLPIEAIKSDACAALEAGPVVISAPTGSGKSTQVPRWCPGPVLVIEPRRVAARTLAARVAHLENTPLGEAVGYHVRDDKQAGKKTRILFVTPGIALLEFKDLDRFATIIIDEFHERSLDIDLLFAMLKKKRKGRTVVMSATLDADRIAEALGGRHLRAEGRMFDVALQYAEQGPTFPTTKNLVPRAAAAIERMLEHPGDMLVFLPGKGEIAQVARAVFAKGAKGAKIVELHGGLSPKEQANAFLDSEQKKILLATNVAETSVTVPGVRIVIDTGLVRQTRYHQSRGALALVPIAADSAEQRRGRAGRLAPGVCLRLWGPAAQLKARTPPEVFRDALAPLVLAASACGHDAEQLPFLDPPKAHALQTAKEELRLLGALSEADELTELTETGRELFRLPLDPSLGRLLIESKNHDCLEDAIDLIAVLAAGRPLFLAPEGRAPLDDDDPRSKGCDATAMVNALRASRPVENVIGGVLNEAKRHRRRLRKVMGLLETKEKRSFDRLAVAKAAIAADWRSAHIARTRKRKVAWANGGTEIELDRRSALELITRDGLSKLPEAMVVFGIRAVSEGAQTRIIATSATPVSLGFLERAGLGRSRLAGVKKAKGGLIATIEQVFAKKILSSREITPQGALLRQAVKTLLIENRIRKGVYKTLKARLESADLLMHLAGAKLIEVMPEELEPLSELELDPELFIEAHLEALGLEEHADLQLLEDEDLLPSPLPEYLQERLDREYPRQVDLGDARYRVEYEPRLRRATLYLTQGARRAPPPRQYLPRFFGLKIQIQAGGTIHQL